MKKVFALLLTLALIATLSVATFAETITAVPSSDAQDLGVTYTGPAGSSDIIYSIDIDWDSDLAFDYNAGTQGAWNPDEHDYADATGAQWSDNEVTVTVTNHSNAAVVASIAIVDAAEADGVTVTADKASAPLASAVGTALASAPAATFTLTATGTPTANIAKVATATVSITAAE